MATLPLDMPPVKLENAADVVGLLAATINQTRRGEIAPRVGSTIGYLANVLLGATDQRDLETRIAELESLVKNRSKPR